MTTSNQELRDLRAEVKQLRASIASETRNGHLKLSRSDVEEFAKDVGNDARELAHNAGASIRQAWSKSRNAAVDAYGDYEASVARHPLSSTALAFAGGLLLAALIRRR
ncbi:MAG: hypothetical protein K2Q12_03830 [Rickettsiales bacterium]|nr:hypothetical protein [Rickettsiales bacterium]